MLQLTLNASMEPDNHILHNVKKERQHYFVKKLYFISHYHITFDSSHVGINTQTATFWTWRLGHLEQECGLGMTTDCFILCIMEGNNQRHILNT